jgi:hypothetical protein
MKNRRLSFTGFMSLATVAVVFAASAARAESPEPTGPIGQTQAAAQSAYYTKPICKKEHVTGSNIPKRVCRTQAQIDAERAAAQQLMKDTNAQLGRETTPGGGLGENPMHP